MTGERDVSSPTVQPTVQHRPESECIVGAERGLRCLPVVPGSPYCDNHHPDRKERRREITRLAARASHARRPDPELDAWADSLDWSTEGKREQGLRDVAVLVAKGGLTPAQGNAIAALARAANPKTSTKPTTPGQNLIVEVQRFTSTGITEGAPTG